MSILGLQWNHLVLWGYLPVRNIGGNVVNWPRIEVKLGRNEGFRRKGLRAEKNVLDEGLALENIVWKGILEGI